MRKPPHPDFAGLDATAGRRTAEQTLNDFLSPTGEAPHYDIIADIQRRRERLGSATRGSPNAAKRQSERPVFIQRLEQDPLNPSMGEWQDVDLS